jgi:hypothetical protein
MEQKKPLGAEVKTGAESSASPTSSAAQKPQ